MADDGAIDGAPTLDELLGHATLRALVDRLIPADTYPSGWQAGVDAFLRRILRTERPDAVATLAAGLDGVDAEAVARCGAAFGGLTEQQQDELLGELQQGHTSTTWSPDQAAGFVRLLNSLTTQGFYADPGNGGNRDGVSWRMVGYLPEPAGTVWSIGTSTDLAQTPFDDVRSHYDAIVVGCGAGGGVAACLLAEAGHRVLAVERGSWLAPGDLRGDHLRSHRALFGYAQSAGPPATDNPRVFVADGHEHTIPPTDGRWNNNAMTVGGGTRVYGGQAWRFAPEDFAMATTYGVPDGSSLADWPISYDELEPYYDRAEWELGVSGDPAGFTGAGWRRRGYPLPPVERNLSGAKLAAGARALGWSTGRVPLLINSEPYDGRSACTNCGQCVGFGCRADAKNGSHNTVLPRALATGNCDLLTETQAERILTRDDGRVRGVALLTTDASGIRRREVTADQVILGAGAIETARLLLNSPSAREPRGLGNNTDQVGRHLQGHVYAGAVGVFDDIVQNSRGPGPTISTHDFRHGNEGLIGGGMLANDFVPMPLATYATLTSTGMIPAYGLGSKQGMRDLYQRTTTAMGPIQETPNPLSRVTVDTGVRDGFGIPVARLSGGVLDVDRPCAEMLRRRAVEWLEASGAARTAPIGGVGRGPSAGQHQAGTCRMGADPRASVVDPEGRVWGHDNLRIADGSVHVTNGAVNPVLTIFAGAYRITDLLVRA